MNAEQISSFLVCSIFSVPVIFFAIILCHGKGADMIAGFNTASSEERAKWNETALCRAVGILLAVSTIFGLIYINKSKSLRRK